LFPSVSKGNFSGSRSGDKKAAAIAVTGKNARLQCPKKAQRTSEDTCGAGQFGEDFLINGMRANDVKKISA
jgi:hypothetical protein